MGNNCFGLYFNVRHDYEMAFVPNETVEVLEDRQPTLDTTDDFFPLREGPRYLVVRKDHHSPGLGMVISGRQTSLCCRVMTNTE